MERAEPKDGIESECERKAAFRCWENRGSFWGVAMDSQRVCGYFGHHQQGIERVAQEQRKNSSSPGMQALQTGVPRLKLPMERISHSRRN
eukprot:4143073-Pleurochrysis_carterae.AAC.1